jgi:hypothetical protein
MRPITMRPITTRPVIATLAAASLACTLVGWVVAMLIGSTGGVTGASNRCSGALCTSQTWLWAPAMRRAR